MTPNASAAHTLTRATVHRAGQSTVLVTIHGWYNEQLLAPVRTEILLEVTGQSRAELPGSCLWVMARLDATAAAGLALHGWSLDELAVPRHTQAAPLGSGADMWAGTLAAAVPAARRAA